MGHLVWKILEERQLIKSHRKVKQARKTQERSDETPKLAVN